MRGIALVAPALRGHGQRIAQKLRQWMGHAAGIARVVKPSPEALDQPGALNHLTDQHGPAVTAEMALAGVDVNTAVERRL